VFDIDGVLADLTHGLTKRANAKWGTPVIQGEDQPTWSFKNCLTDEQQDEIWGEIFSSPTFWEELAPICTPSEIRLMALLGHRRDVELMYLTNRTGVEVERQTQRWLREHGFPWGELAFTRDKAAFLKGCAETKYGPGVSLRSVVLGVLEDAPANIEAMRAVGAPVYTMSRPYNLGLDGLRVSTVREFCEAM
jgi:hypothetical protein